MDKLEYLEAERQKIWEKIVELQEEIKKKTSDYETDAQQASKKCSEFRNKCEVTKKEAESLLKKIQAASSEITDSNISTQITDIQTFHTELSPKKVEIEAHISELEELFENHASYAEKLEKLESISTSADDSSAKIEAVLEQLTTRKKEVDKLYYEIFGYTQKDEATGVETKVAGKKEDLDNAYSALKKEFEEYQVNKKTEIEVTFNSWEKSYVAAQTKIESLLPNALTAGLSHAYSSKKDAEIKERDKFSNTFRNWIWVLIGISLIPFGVSVYMLLHGTTLVDALQKLPNLVLSILPLYIPPLWVTLSASKKVNLSKRLIEEYTHKEVVSKTFEGLSTQIEGIKDSKISAELRAKLLHNILEISIENPGKLISDYNKSDHPILEKISGLSKNTESKSDKPKGSE